MAAPASGSRRQSQAVASCLALFLCDLVLADSLFSLCVSGPLETSSWLSPGHFGSSFSLCVLGLFWGRSGVVLGVFWV